MATWTLNRPASTNITVDTDLATETVALDNSPADFATASAVSISSSTGAVSVPAWGDDQYGMNVRIMSGATVLAANTAGGVYETVQAISADWSAAKDFPAITFTYVNTSATKTQWDAAVIEYEQRWTKTKGSDSANIQVTSATNAITVTYTAAATDITADDLESAGELTRPAIGETHILAADDLQSLGQLSTPEIGQEHAVTADDLESAGNVSSPVLAENTQNDLLADDLESASSVTSPALATSVFALLADDLQSASNVSTPTAAEDTQNDLLADDLQSAGELSQPAVTQTHALLADDLQSVGQLSTPDLGENIERLAPDADTSIGNWTDEGDGTTNIYQSIDEWPFADGDYIQSEVGPSASAYRASLTNPVATINTADTQTVRYRYGKSPGDSNQVDLTVRLIEGASTVIATWTHTNVSDVLSDASQPLSAGQKASITNHDNLSIEFEANAP